MYHRLRDQLHKRDARTIKIDKALAPFMTRTRRVLLKVHPRDRELIAGTRLPAVRQLATELGIAPNTVARAYRELESDGFLETRGRNGTIVKAKGGDAAALLQLDAQAYAARAAALGIAPDEALAFVRRALG